MSRRLLQTMLKTIPADWWPAPGETLVIGISGGIDSTVLACLLNELNISENRRWRIHLAHLNHGLRGRDSAEDAEFVVQLAKKRHWEVTVEDRPIQKLTEESGKTLEEVARNERYTFFERVLKKTKSKVVATAHHAEDNAETVLYRVIRGTGLRGLSGIPAFRLLRKDAPYRVIRPLLNVRRSEILEYLKDNKISYRHDLTNEGTGFTRNRIRNELIPDLEADYNPAVRDALLRLAEQARWVNHYLQGLVDQKYPKLILYDSGDESPREIVLDAKKLLKEPQLIQTELVRRAVVALGVGERRLSFDHYVSIVELAAKNVSGKRLELPSGVVVALERKRLIFTVLSQK